jgi:hypothetical protein
MHAVRPHVLLFVGMRRVDIAVKRLFCRVGALGRIGPNRRGTNFQLLDPVLLDPMLMASSS